MGALETEVLAALWSRHPEAATPAQRQDALGQAVTYSTITTILSRLGTKGLVARERQGRGFVYRPLVSEAELTAVRMRAQLDRAHDREATLSRFVDALAAKDERALRRVLRDSPPVRRRLDRSRRADQPIPVAPDRTLRGPETGDHGHRRSRLTR
jgi:predicted transcriptional regulator